MMMKDPYSSGMFTGNPYFDKSDILGSLVVVLQGRLEKRGLQIISPPSRCVKKYEVHELIASDEENIKPGGTVDNVAYLGFVEISQGGVITIGDEVICGGKIIGVIAGFDETHMPNHQNIILHCGERISGAELGLCLGDAVTFRQVKE